MKGHKPRGEVLEFAAGTTRARNLGIHVGSTGGLVIDRSDDLVLADQGEGTYFPAQVDVFPPGSSTPQTQIAGYAYGIALNQDESQLWVAGAFQGYVAGLSYPSGQVLDVISPDGLALGVATSPSD
jgi:hypothetical protein